MAWFAGVRRSMTRLLSLESWPTLTYCTPPSCSEITSFIWSFYGRNVMKFCWRQDDVNFDLSKGWEHLKSAPVQNLQCRLHSLHNPPNWWGAEQQPCWCNTPSWYAIPPGSTLVNIKLVHQLSQISCPYETKYCENPKRIMSEDWTSQSPEKTSLPTCSFLRQF